MIQKLLLENWKSFKNAELYIDPLTFLIGTNACGKSNILDALQFLYRIASGISINSAINGDLGLSAIRGGCEWLFKLGESTCKIGVDIKLGQRNATYTYSISLRKIDSNRCEILDERLSVHTPTAKNPDKILYYTDREEPGHAIIPVYFHTGKQGKPRRLDINRASAILSQLDNHNINKDIKEIAKNIREDLKKIFILDPIPSHMRAFSRLSVSLSPDAANIAGVLAAMDESQKSEIEKKITTYLRPLPEKDIKRIWAEKVGLLGTDAIIYCEEEWTPGNGIIIDARGMSDGTLRFISIITALLTTRENSLLVIEEIDNGFHPSRAKELLKVLKELANERNIDILCTTHNPALIDAAGNSMIPFISYVKRNDNTGDSEIELLEEKSDIIKLLAGSSIGTLMILDKI